MANYLLIEDNEVQWHDIYNPRIKRWIEEAENSLYEGFPNLKKLQAHPNNSYKKDYNTYRDFLRERLEQDDVDLLVCDIALGGGDNHFDHRFWISTLLEEVITSSPLIQNNLNSRGMGLILISQHGSAIAEEILGVVKTFLSEWFTWEYLSKNSFDPSFLDKFNQVSGQFREVGGKWCHVEKVQAYLGAELGNNITEVEYKTYKQVNWNQIIAIESDINKTIIYYTDNPIDSPIRVKKIETTDYNGENRIDRLINLFKVIYLHRGTPDNLDIETIYFMHIKQRPFTIINHNSYVWNAKAHRNHGRILTLNRGRFEDDLEVSFHCRFEHLNGLFNIG